MNILTLIKTHPKRIGGIERWLIDHTANLVKKGHSHTVYFEDTPADVVKNALVEAGADVEVYAFDRQWLKSLMKLRRTVKETQADVVHMHFYAPIIGSMSFVLWLMGIPLVVHYRISGEPSKPGTLAKVLKKARFYLLGRSIKKVVCVSAYTQSKFLTDYQVPSALTEVVHNGISDSVQPHPAVELLERQGERAIVVAAHLIPEKGIQTAIAAMPSVIQKHPTAHLYIAGEGAFRRQLEAIQDNLNLREAVTFLGMRGDVPSLFAAASVVLVPSVWAEACANTIIEAMAVGAPLVASSVGGNPELVHNEVHGLIVAKEDEEALAAAIDRLLGDAELAKNLSQNAQARARSDLNIRKLIDACLRVYEEVTA